MATATTDNSKITRDAYGQFTKDGFCAQSPTTWTKEYMIEEIEGLHKTFRENDNIIWFNDLFEHKSYSRHAMNGALRKWKEEDYVCQLMIKLWEMMGDRLALKGLKGDTVPTNTIFTQKSQFGWIEKAEHIKANAEAAQTVISSERLQLLKRLEESRLLPQGELIEIEKVEEDE